MLTVEKVGIEYFGIEELLGQEGINQKMYNAHCKNGFSTHYIKRYLKLTFNGVKEKIGAKKASTLRPAHTYAVNQSRFRCNRDGKEISTSDCVPGCNDKCISCENKQMENIKAGADTLTPEEHKEQTLAGTYRSSAAIAVEDGYRDES